MQLFPFLIVCISAVTHGIWNFLAKGANNKDIFIGLSKISEATIFLIPFLFLINREGYGDSQWLIFVVIASCFVFLNYFFLGQAYKHADLSVAYPISRSSILFLPFLAFFFIGERIDAVGFTSIILILTGVLCLQLQAFSREEFGQMARKLARPGIVFALLAALMAASYTLWDKVAVSRIHPFLYFYSYTFITALFYVIFLGTRFKRPEVNAEWEQKKWSIVAVGLLNTFTYLLVLSALAVSKASYVGALRQLSLVIGVVLGWRFLNEERSTPQMVGVVLLMLGSGLIALAR
ncbi:MAG: EamA family transporter [Anaerolineae bacterium]